MPPSLFVVNMTIMDLAMQLPHSSFFTSKKKSLSADLRTYFKSTSQQSMKSSQKLSGGTFNDIYDVDNSVCMTNSYNLSCTLETHVDHIVIYKKCGKKPLCGSPQSIGEFLMPFLFESTAILMMDFSWEDSGRSSTCPLKLKRATWSKK
jgi:hypothetical protein